MTSKSKLIGIYVCATLIIILILVGITYGLSYKDDVDSVADLSLKRINSKSLKVITYKGLHGRLGNHLFQIAATLGFAKQYNRCAKFTKWEHSSLFENSEEFFSPISEEELQAETIDLNETECFEYTNNYKPDDFCEYPIVNITGYRQSSKYFNFIAYDLRRFFTFRSGLKSFVQFKMLEITSHPFIGVHVRKGDYSGHPVHEVCNIDYYLYGINFFRKQHPDAYVLIITDDKVWCRENILPKLTNACISPFESEHHDFISLSLCQFKVISNSTFGFWACWIDARSTSDVMAPRPWINQTCKSYEQIYPSEWHIYDISKQVLTISPKIVVNIGAYYQCYKEPHAFLNACQSFRRVYPTSTLVIVSDNGDDFSHAAKYFNAASYKTNKKRGGNGATTHITALDQIIVFITNFLQGAKQISEDYFILMEDDVSIGRSIQMAAGFKDDIIGNNSILADFPVVLQKYVNKQVRYYGGCGGSLFKRSFWANLDMKKVEVQLREFQKMYSQFHTDMVLSFLCYANDGSICCGQQLFDSEFVQEIDFKKEKIPAVYHLYKDLYGVPVTPREQLILLGQIHS
jgi:glycosyl transferase family 11